MAFALTDFEPCIRSHQHEWTAMSVEVRVNPISPNYGKAISTTEFESADWLASVAAWETGEIELDAGRKADVRGVSKHYDLNSSVQLDEVFAELVALLRDGTVPPDAVTW
ncbi:MULTISPECIES: hypothetical protein [unclassified Nocardioides]|uniref:hypothetical protein n=1 Tax=unclassified Nocardioides TaxID=2615069 RepID=UPI0030147BB1